MTNNNNNNNGNGDNLVHAFSGALGGMVSLGLTYPLVTVSSRLQVQTSGENVDKVYYKGSWEAFVDIIRTKGFLDLFSGLQSALLGIAVTNGVYYYFFEWSRKLVIAAKLGIKGGELRNMTTMESIFASVLAGSATVILSNPIWVVNTRVIVGGSGKNEKKSSLQVLRQIVKEDGIMALWQGVKPALVLVTNPVIQFTVFEQLKTLLEKRIKRLKGWHFFLLGALSKLIATASTYPYIVVKSRMQLKQKQQQQQSTRKEQRNSMAAEFSRLIKQEGLKGLYYGIYGKLLQSVLTAAFLFYTKEKFYRLSLALLKK